MTELNNLSKNKKLYNPSFAWPSPRYAWFVVLALTLANTVSFIDRQILSLLVEPIREDLNINDTQISLLQGFAFVVFYVAMGLPIARLADSKNRKYIIIIGITLWSVMTAICGLAKTFWHLFIARMGVGVGEASLSPSAHSMLSDYFPPDKLSFPLGVYAAGITSGMGIALVAGAAVIDLINKVGIISIPYLGILKPWQTTFIVVGALGSFVILLMFFVREPKRIGKISYSDVRDKNTLVPLKEVIKYLKLNWKSYSTIYLGFTMTAASAYGLASWTPTFYIRTFGMSASEAGYLIGVSIVVGGLFGSVFGGWLADFLAKKCIKNSKIKVMLLSSILLVPPGLITPLMPNPTFAALGLAVSFFAGSMGAGPAASAAQEMTPNEMRAQASAFYLFLTNLIGLGLGPTVVALFTDYVFADIYLIRYSLIFMVLTFNPIAIVLIRSSFKHYDQTINRLQKEM